MYKFHAIYIVHHSREIKHYACVFKLNFVAVITLLEIWLLSSSSDLI